MTLKNLKRALIRAGYEVKQSKLTNNRDVLVIKHDYFGPYPTTETWNVVEDLRKRAARAGLTAENTPNGPKVDEVPLTEAAAAYGIKKRSFYERLNA